LNEEVIISDKVKKIPVNRQDAKDLEKWLDMMVLKINKKFKDDRKNCEESTKIIYKACL
jgi:hypothetical protein